MTAPGHRARLVGIVVLVEVASGMPFGVVKELVPVWLRVQGTGLAEIGALTLVGLPWTFKPLWAPLVDRYGSFPAWMLAGLGLATALTVALPWIPPILLAGLLVGIALASATQDIAVDGYLVARVPRPEQGRVNGARIGAYRGAMAIAGGGGVVLGDTLGWPVAFGTIAAIQLLLMAGEARLGPVERAPSISAKDWLAELARWLLRWERLPLLLFFLTYKLGDAAMAPMVKPFLLTRMDASAVGLLSTTAGAVLVAVGALVGGEVVSRFGLVTGLAVAGVVQALSNLGYGAAAVTASVPAAVAASVAESFTQGFGTAGLIPLAVRAAEGGQAATRFALVTAILGLTRELSGAISGVAVENVGYSTWFVVTFFLALPALVLIPLAVRAVRE